jgi:septum formation protein
LAQIGLQPLLLPQSTDESVLPGEAALAYVQRIAAQKADSAWVDPQRTLDLPVLAADTTVTCAGEVLGKPESLAEAQRILRTLAGRCHEVLTAVVVRQGQRRAQEVVSTVVEFREITDAEIAAYWQSGEPRDKAGSYGIQGRGALFIRAINGSYSNVVGLPLHETSVLLAAFGISTLHLLQQPYERRNPHQHQPERNSSSAYRAGLVAADIH